MSTLYFRFGGLPTGLTLKATLRDHAATDSYWNQAILDFQASAPSFADASIALTEQSGNYLGVYTGTADIGTYSAAVPLTAYVHNSASPTTPLMSVDFGVQGGEEISTPYLNQRALDIYTRLGAPAGASVSADIGVIDGIVDQILPQVADIYTANIEFNLDNTNTRDEYTVTWRKNATILTSGITSPTIQVIKRVDGTNLIASTSMTQIGSTGSYKYDEATNRVTIGEAVLVKVQATIDAGTRTWQRVLVRDAT